MAGTALSRPRIYAVEDTAIQVCWSATAGGGATVSIGSDHEVSVGHGGPAAVRVEGLEPAASVTVKIQPGAGPAWTDTVTTLSSPPGEELVRFATVNDLHIGAERFGTLRPRRESEGADAPHPVRCARAALAEAQRWGAQLIVAKGDLTQHSRAEEWDVLASLLRVADCPVLAVAGNHDTVRGLPHHDTARLTAWGIGWTDEIAHLDLPGIRVVVASTAIPHRHPGRVAHATDDIIELALGAAERGASTYVGLHHDLQRWRWPTHWPPGVPGPESRDLLARLHRANPRSLVSTGHSHRNRRHAHTPLPVTEIASTKDYPGVWAGYVVHEGGIRQVVQRVAAPDAISWTDPGHRVLGGVWGPYADGRRVERCFTVTYPR